MEKQKGLALSVRVQAVERMLFNSLLHLHAFPPFLRYASDSPTPSVEDG
jgi:hypothetical protein